MRRGDMGFMALEFLLAIVRSQIRTPGFMEFRKIIDATRTFAAGGFLSARRPARAYQPNAV